MAGIYDTLAQARLDTAALGADAEKAARGAEAWKKAQAIKAAADTAKAAPAAAGPWYSNPTRSIGLPAVSPKAAGIGAKALSATGRVATVVAPAIEAGRTAMVAASPIMTGADVAEQASGGVGKLATAGLGATGGAALGAMTGPLAPIAVPAGALVGGALGYYGGDTAIRAAKSLLGLDTRTPYERLPESPAPAATPPVVAQPQPAAIPVPVEAAPATAPVAAAPAGAVRDTYVNRAAPGSLASFFGAAVHQRRVAGQEAAAQAAALHMPELAKTTAEATNLQERAKLAAAEKDPVKKAAILGGYSPPAPEKVVFPEALQPTATNAGYGVANVGGKLVQVPIQQQVRGGKGADGKYYKIDAQGKQSEMTPQEQAQFIAQGRGPGAVQ